MLKVMAFLVKKQDLDTSDLIDYYERHHVPLILSLAPAPTTDKRNYLARDAAIHDPDDFDIVTEPAGATLAYQNLLSTMPRIRRRRGRNDLPRSHPDEISYVVESQQQAPLTLT